MYIQNDAEIYFKNCPLVHNWSLVSRTIERIFGKISVTVYEALQRQSE